MYQATVAARLSQFGSTVIEFNVTDTKAVMPRVRAARKFPTEKLSKEDISKAAAACEVACLEIWQKQQKEAVAKADFEANFKPEIDAELAAVAEKIRGLADKSKALPGAEVVKRVQVRLEVV